MTKPLSIERRRRRLSPLERLMNKVEIVGDCWEFQGGRSGSGYGTIRGMNQKMTGAHQLSYQLHHGDIPLGKEICHTCDNKICVNPDHLFVGTHKENMDDMIAKGRQAKGRTLNHPSQEGENNHGRKINLDQALTVKEIATVGFRQCEIMRYTRVTRSNVWAIINEKSWSHL